MKQFFEEYGGIALGVLALILLIVMVSPLKNAINFNLRDTVKAATQKAEKQDKMAAEPTADNLNPDHIIYPIAYDTLGGNNIPSTEGWHLPDTFPAPVKPGYRFQGWWRDNVYTKKAIVGEQIGGPTTLYSKWELLYYSISYYLNGGSMSGEVTEYTVETPTFSLPTPSKTGYTFLGWTGTELSGHQTSVSIPKGSIGNRNYTANWSVNQYAYNVRYISSSGKQLGSKIYTRDFGTSETITPPTYAGYNTPAVKEVAWDSTTAKTIDFNYNLITYSVSYDANGGSLSGQKTSYNVEDNSFTLPTPSRTGYTFLGWTGSNGNTPQTSVTVSTGTTGNLSYKANWKANQYTYNVRYFSSSGKSLGTTSYTRDFGTSETINAPAKTGYNTPSGQSVKWDSTSAKTIDFTYGLINYSVSYNMNGGSISGQKTSFTIEDSAFSLPTPSRTGYTFAGWTGSNGTTPQTSITIGAGSSGNKTYTANWNPIMYYFDVNHTLAGSGIGSSTAEGVGTFDVYINGSLVANDAGDYYAQHQYGSTWEIKDIKAKSGYSYNGVSGGLSGTLTGTTATTLNWGITNYTISYNLKGGSASNITSYNVRTNNFTLANPSLSGWNFSGWTGTGLGSASTSVTVYRGSTGNRSYTANYYRTISGSAGGVASASDTGYHLWKTEINVYWTGAADSYWNINGRYAYPEEDLYPNVSASVYCDGAWRSSGDGNYVSSASFPSLEAYGYSYWSITTKMGKNCSQLKIRCTSFDQCLENFYLEGSTRYYNSTEYK